MSESPKKLTDFKVLAFDVYGTLADADTGVYNALQPLLSKYSSSVKWTRQEALDAFNAVEHDLQTRYPDLLFSDLLAKVHETLEQRLKALSGKEVETTTLEGDPSTLPSATGASTSTSDATSAADADSSTANPHIIFAQSVKDWGVFSDTTEALHKLAKYYKLVVLSNTDNTSFGYTHAKLSEGDSAKPSSTYSYPNPNPDKYWFPQTIPGSKSPFTLILTAQDVHSYKPALAGFNVALRTIQSDPRLLDAPDANDVKEKLLWVAQSITHDIEPCQQLGLTSVWINRKGSDPGVSNSAGPQWTWSFRTAGEFAEAVEKAFAASE